MNDNDRELFNEIRRLVRVGWTRYADSLDAQALEHRKVEAAVQDARYALEEFATQVRADMADIESGRRRRRKERGLKYERFNCVYTGRSNIAFALFIDAMYTRKMRRDARRAGLQLQLTAASELRWQQWEREDREEGKAWKNCTQEIMCRG